MALRVCVAASGVSFVAYLLTLCPTVGAVDSGELTLAAYHLDVAHPPGFPLYTLLGWVATHVGPWSPARSANMLSAILAAAACGTLAVALFRVSGSWVAALASAFCFSLGRTPWSWATVAEVYSLQNLLLAILLALVLAPVTRKGRALIGYVVGLSLANHVGTAVSVLPATAVLAGGGQALAPLGLLVVALSVYVGIPLRCLAGPLFNWGSPCTLQRFIWHVTGKQYQVHLSLSPSNMLHELSAFGSSLMKQYPVWLLPLIAGGSFLFSRDRRRVGIGLLLLVAGNLLYCSMYSIGQDKDAYYMPTFLAMTVPLCLLLTEIGRRLPRRTAVLVLAIPLVLGARNFSSQNRRHFSLARDYALDALSSVGDRGVLITSDWQVYAPLLYLQEVEGHSPGVAAIDILLLKRTWYLRYLARRWPQLMAASEPALEDYRKLLYRFEYGLSYDGATIQMAYVGLINALISAAEGATGGFAHLLGAMDWGVGRGMRAIPRGIVERLLPPQAPAAYEEVPLHVETILGRDPDRTEVGGLIKAHYAHMLLRHASLLAAAGSRDAARQKRLLATQLAPISLHAPSQ